MLSLSSYDKEELDTFSCGDKDLDDFFHRDEMKLHKLLYFTQRECLIQKGEPMFDAQFEAWKYGPVMVQIRQHYKNDSLPELMDKEQVVQYEPVFDMVFKNLCSTEVLEFEYFNAWRVFLETRKRRL